jgi:serpin B
MNTSGAYAATGRTATRLGTVLLVAIVGAACAGTSQTAAPSSSPTGSPLPSPSASPSANPTIELTPSPSLAPSISAWPTSAAGFELAKGKAALLAPAADKGAVAGTAINGFGFDLLRQLDSKGNLAVSPTSIALALAMVQPGARGDTATQIDKVLHGLGSTAGPKEIVALMASFKGDVVYLDADGNPLEPPAKPKPGSVPQGLEVAGQAFAQKGLNLQTDYLNALSSTFGAGAGVLDFASDPEAARKAINKWASMATHGVIPEVLPPGTLDPSTVIALANAVYMNAAWQMPFDPAATKSRPFHKADGTSIAVPTMAMETLTGYAAGTGWRALSLGYDGVGMRMTLVVPDNMDSFVSGLTPAQFADIQKHESEYDVDLTLPRFTAASSLDLAGVLGKMGMSNAFEASSADFSGIDGSRDIYLGSVIHATKVDVNEKGTVAAAVTVIGGLGGCCAPPPPKTTFHIDKPFLYFITDVASGAVLFMGRVNDPSIAG